jgi:NAD(P)-dependent dehydrogenase (short-subunit alcohol dehydrogenase family)
MSRNRAASSPPVALVTGASGGIGEACASELEEAGYLVFGTSRVPREGVEPGGTRMLRLDVREDNSVADCVSTVMSLAGRIDVLVNNAGVAIAGALEETSIDEFKNVMDTNLFGAVRMMRAVLPIMREQRSGRIVNIGSVTAFLPMPYSAAYCASKHAMRGLSESVDHEVREFGIRVIVIEPGFIRTDIVRHSPTATPIEAYASTREMAAATFERRLSEGEDPAVVARSVVEAVTADNPDGRYLPDGFSRVVSMARGFLPSSLFDGALRRYLGLD